MSECSIIILCFFISIMTFPSKSLEANTKSFHSFHLKGIKSSQRFQRNVLIIILSQVLQNFFQKYECLNSTWKALWNMSLFMTNPSHPLSSKTWSICWKLWARVIGFLKGQPWGESAAVDLHCFSIFGFRRENF